MRWRYYGSRPGITQHTSTSNMCGYHTHNSGFHCTLMNQYAYYGKGTTIHSVRQLSHCGLEIDNQSSAIPDHKQCMVTPNWWIIPLNIINGLTRMPMQASMDEDLDKLPHVICSDDIWDPTILDHSIDIKNDIYHPGMDPRIDEEDFTSFDECTSMTRTIYITILTALITSVMSTTMNE